MFLQIHESSEAKDLIQLILKVDPDKRPWVDGILAHPWCKADVGTLSSRSLLHSLGSMYQLQQLPSLMSLGVDFENPINLEMRGDCGEIRAQDEDSVIMI